MRFEEQRNIIIDIPVKYNSFSDNKEITELFKYVFERSELYCSSHPHNTFSIEYNNYGYMICKFTLTLDADDEFYAQRVADLKSLIGDYEAIEKEYLRFKVFGNIESGALIRREH